MLKNDYVKKIQDTNIQDMFTYVNINEDALEKISEKIKNDWGLDEDMTYLTLANAYKLVDMGEIEYSDIDYDFSDFDNDEYSEFLSEIVKKANNYLVYLPNSTWNGASGCGIVNSLEDAFIRDYDCHQYIKAVSKGNKAVLLRECHHDVPMGHHVVIVALTDAEYNKLEDSNFYKMQDFALKYLKALETNKKELYKTIVNL